MFSFELSRKLKHYTFITIRCGLPRDFHFMATETVISPDIVNKVSYNLTSKLYSTLCLESIASYISWMLRQRRYEK
jgi:hypothetical protein